MRPRVLLVESIHAEALAWLRGQADVIVAPDPREETLLALAPDCDAVIIRASGRVDARFLSQAPRLRVVARHGVGLDNIDVDACTRRGVRVVHTPLATVEAVAEHTAGLMLAVAKGIVGSDTAVRTGEFSSRRSTAVAVELRGKTLGVVGFGRIGRRVAEICRAAFAMAVLFADVLPRHDAAVLLHAERVPLDELLARSDVVSLHVPLTAETYHLVDAVRLARLRPGAILINTSRGAVVDEAALVPALEDRRLAVGLDVYEQEPLPVSSPLIRLANVVLTPHVASHTEEALRAMGMVADDVMRVLRGDPPRHPANILPGGIA